MLARSIIKAAFGIILFVMGSSVASAFWGEPRASDAIREPVDGRTHRA